MRLLLWFLFGLKKHSYCVGNTVTSSHVPLSFNLIDQEIKILSVSGVVNLLCPHHRVKNELTFMSTHGANTCENTDWFESSLVQIRIIF